MNAELVFELGGRAAMSGWVALAAGLFLTRLRAWLFAYAGRVLPTALAMGYVALLAWFLRDPPGGVSDPGSLAGVKVIYQNDAAVTAAWWHFLAFDLFVGAWIANDGLRRQVWRAALLPLLALTFLAGPAGLLAYLLVRTLRRPERHIALPSAEIAQ